MSMNGLKKWREAAGKVVVPRKNALQKHKLNPSSRKYAIEAKCWDCAMGQRKEIKECTCTDCSLFSFRPYK